MGPGQGRDDNDEFSARFSRHKRSATHANFPSSFCRSPDRQILSTAFKFEADNNCLAISDMKRNRSKPHSFEERLATASTIFRKQACRMPPGKERELLLRKASQVDTAVRINNWLRSPAIPSQKQTRP
jgi:hypothetical protein